MFSSLLVLGKQCLITSSSSSVALCHLRKGEQKEILANFRASLVGTLLWVDIRPDLGQCRVEETSPQARWCTWGALKPTSPAARTGGDILLSCSGLGSQLASWPKGHFASCGSEHLLWTADACGFGHVFVGCTQSINKFWDFADEDEETTSIKWERK